MPTVLTHPLVAFSLSPLFKLAGTGPVVRAGAILSIVPDVDVIGFGLGIEYGDRLGHRGITHSILFAAALSVIVTFFLGRERRHPSSWVVGLFLFVCASSHGFFDAMTDGGLGVAFFAPLDWSRYFLPWQPLRVSPIGIAGFFSAGGWQVLASEVLWIWVPLAGLGLVARVAAGRKGSRRLSRCDF